MALTGRLVALAALGVLLTPLPGGYLATWAVLLALAVTVDVLAAARIADLRLSRDAAPAVRLGESGETVLRVANAGRRRLRAELRDAWVPSAGITPRRQQVDIPAGERRRIPSRLVPTRRGVRRASAVTVRSVGPLGLAGRQRTVAVPGELRVLPAFTSRKFLPEKLSRLRQIDGAVLVRQRGQGTEFDSLREYVAGDDVRAIDWRATARSRDVVVRTWRPERDRHVVIALDTGRTSAARLGDAPRLDAAIDASLLLGVVASRAGDRVALVAADVRIRARTGLTAGRDVLPTLVTALTPLEPALVETDATLFASEILQRLSKRSLVVLFSSLDTVASDSGLIPAVRSLVGRHQVVVASVGDPTVWQLARARGDAAEVYEAAAAERALQDRRTVSEHLTRLGAVVVDAPADVFASHVTDAYLDLKAAGRL